MNKTINLFAIVLAVLRQFYSKIPFIARSRASSREHGTSLDPPALEPKGRDLRPLQSGVAPSETQQLLNKITKVEEKNSQLEAKLEEILRILRKG
jgi:hypothetical protein